MAKKLRNTRNRTASSQKSVEKAQGKRFVGGRAYDTDSPDYNIKKAEKALGVPSLNSIQDTAENVLSILGVTFEKADRDYSFLQEITRQDVNDKIAWEETKNKNISISDKFPDETDNIFTPDKSPPQVVLKDYEKIQKPTVGVQQLASDLIKYTKRLPQIK